MANARLCLEGSKRESSQDVLQENRAPKVSMSRPQESNLDTPCDRSLRRSRASRFSSILFSCSAKG